MTTVNADYTILQIVRDCMGAGNATMSDGGAGEALEWRFAILATLYRYHGDAAGADLLRARYRGCPSELYPEDRRQAGLDRLGYTLGELIHANRVLARALRRWPVGYPSQGGAA